MAKKKKGRKPDMWDWGPRDAKKSRESTGKGIGRKYAPHAIPGTEERIASWVTPMTQRKKYRRRHQKKWLRTKEGRSFNKKKREILAFHPHESTPKRGKEGRWRPIVNEQGNHPDVSADLKGIDYRERAPRGRAPQDKSYGKDLDFEGAAQMNSRIESYSKES